MRNCVFKEILLISNLERKARKITFDPKITVIIGANQTGKSLLLKSIFYTFGAEAAILTSNRSSLPFISAVRFSVDNQNYTILRDGRFFAIFDHTERLIKTFSDIPTELSSYLAKLFDFKLKLNNRKRESLSPPPAYYFLPYYMDQDASWAHSWASFAGLSHFINWRTSASEYHTGIRGNKYYTLKAEADKLKTDIHKMQQELIIINAARKQFKQKLGGTFNLNMDNFRSEIEKLLRECQALNNKEQKYKERLVNLKNQLAITEYQIKVAGNTVNEISKDYNFATYKIGNTTKCPTCGEVYENSFVERFRIAQEEDECRQLITRLNGDLEGLREQINDLNYQYTENRQEHQAVIDILEDKKEEIELKDVLEAESKRHVDGMFQENVDSYLLKIESKLQELNTTQEELSEIERIEKDKREEIEDFFESKMFYYSHELNVRTEIKLNAEGININGKIQSSGSELPRILLVYYFSLLHTIRKYTNCVFSPIVLDSPNQQDQDPLNLPKILSFILNNPPENSQLILALADLHDVPYPGYRIELKDKLSLLRKDEYENVSNEIGRLLDKAMGNLFQDI